MKFPLHITLDNMRHQVKNGLRGNRRYPFVLMLEPLYTCNLACMGCSIERHTGKLKDRLPLETCLKATGSETAFVMDSQGLTLTSRGRLHSGEIEAVGTRLMIAFEQASSMDFAAGEVQSLLVEFDHLWLTGLRADAPSGRSFTVGLIGREPVGPSARGHIRECLGALKASEEPLAIPIEL